MRRLSAYLYLLGPVLIVPMLACGDSNATRKADAAAATTAAAARNRSAAEEVRKRAASTLSATTDWSNPESIGRLCEQSGTRELTPDVKARCVTAHLALARVSLKAGKVAEARRALTLASNEGASPAALAASEKLVKTTEAAELKKKEIADAAVKAEARLTYAKLLRERYLDQNLDIKVKVTGKGNDHLTLQFALFNDVWAHKFQKGDLVDEVRKLGFHRVDMTDGYDYHVYWTFE